MVTLSAERIYGIATVSSRLDTQSEQWASAKQRFQAQSTSDQFFRTLGQQLLGVIFPDQHRFTYEINCQYVSEDRLSRVLRLELRLLDDEIIDLPWECLYDPASKLWLGASNFTAISRYVDAHVPPPVPLTPPLRLLVATAEPSDMPSVNAEAELQAIRESLGPLLSDGLVTAKVAPHATRHKLRRAIESFGPHMFHFIGHGKRAGGSSSLLLETDQQRQDPLGMELVLEFLQQSTNLRAAVLNACETSHGAMILAKAGIAAVGMQEKVRTEAAIPFCSSFYQAIAESVPLDIAANRARANVRLECGGDRRDWCLPAVFLPGGRGEVFQIKERDPAKFMPASAKPPIGPVVLPPVELPAPGPAAERSAPALTACASDYHTESDLAATVHEPGNFVSKRLLLFVGGLVVAGAVAVMLILAVVRFRDARPAPAPAPAITIAMDVIDIPAGEAVLGYPDSTLTMRLLAEFWTESSPATTADPLAVYSAGQTWGQMKALAMQNLLNAAPREVSLKPYYIDRAEVTNAEYRRFLADVKAKGGDEFRHPLLTDPRDYTPWAKTWTDPNYNGDNQPVAGVDWFDAYAYAKWAGKRLPTQDEWEFAARGSEGRLYPWGNTFDPRICNNTKAPTRAPTPAGTFPKDLSPFGVLDMGGNLQEWTADELLNGQAAIIRGAGWYAMPGHVFALTFFPWARPRDARTNVTGFRCAKDARVGEAPSASMAFIPGGKARLGGESAPLLEIMRSFPASMPPVQRALFDDEKCKPRKVNMHAFRIGRYEVSKGEYRKFLSALRASPKGDEPFRHRDQPATKDHTPENWSEDSGADDEPVVSVDWWDAYAFTRWAKGRLPTADEWEYAARAGTERLFPWGDASTPGNCNSAEVRRRSAAARGSFPKDRSPFGVMDMGGNVSEWTSDDWPGAPGKAKLLKGGAWGDRQAPESLVYMRHCAGGVQSRSGQVGFRCAWDANQG